MESDFHGDSHLPPELIESKRVVIERGSKKDKLTYSCGRSGCIVLLPFLVGICPLSTMSPSKPSGALDIHSNCVNIDPACRVHRWGRISSEALWRIDSMRRGVRRRWRTGGSVARQDSQTNQRRIHNGPGIGW
jgi:hypothetical protein